MEEIMDNKYILFFKDFNPNKQLRKQSMQIILKNNTTDSMKEISQNISGIFNGTKFINNLGVKGGYWGLVSIMPESKIIEVDYDHKSNKSN